MFSVFVPSESTLKKLPAADPAALPDNAVWIDLLKPTMEEDRAVERLAGIAVPTREDMQEIEISSRLYIESGARYMTDVYFTQSADGGSSWLSPNVRVTGESSSEHDCDGLFPCPGIDYGNQYGDYEGLVSHGGVSHPIWTDSRRQLDTISGCSRNLAMEEVFTAKVHGN